MDSKVRITYYIGTNSNGSVMNEDKIQDSRNYICWQLTSLYGGCTMNRAIGGWNGNNGMVLEDTIVASVIVDSDRVDSFLMDEYPSSLAATYGQECIMVTRENIEVSFVGRK